MTLQIAPSNHAAMSRLFKSEGLDGVDAVVLQGYGAGNLPGSVTANIGALRSRHIAVAVATQCQGGPVDTGIYAVGNDEAGGYVETGDMTLEATHAKLAYLLAKRDDIEAKMLQPLRHELLKNH